jgi:hypothetical protein
LFLSTDKTAYDLIHSFIIRLVSEWRKTYTRTPKQVLQGV